MAFPAARSRSPVTWRASGFVKRRKPSPTPNSTFSTALPPIWWFKDPLDLDGGKFSPRFWCRDVVANEGVTPFEHP